MRRGPSSAITQRDAFHRPLRRVRATSQPPAQAESNLNVYVQSRYVCHSVRTDSIAYVHVYIMCMCMVYAAYIYIYALVWRRRCMLKVGGVRVQWQVGGRRREKRPGVRHTRSPLMSRCCLAGQLEGWLAGWQLDWRATSYLSGLH